MAEVEQENRDLVNVVENGEGVWGFFDAVAEGADKGSVEPFAIVDDDYALAYARNLQRHLGALGAAPSGNLLDVGCALGTITNALNTVNEGDGVSWGLDVSSSATDLAAAQYPRCRFIASLADDLSVFDDGFFNLIHAREFYPFSRFADADYHTHFLTTFLPKLAPGGAVAAVQIVERQGLADSFLELSRRCRQLGYARALRRVVVPYRLYRHFGNAAYLPGVYGALSLLGRGLEAFRPGLVSYLYYFQKGDR